jgi:hypothetical protein
VTASRLANLKLDRPGLRQGRAWQEMEVAVVFAGRPARVSPIHEVVAGWRRRASGRSMTFSADLDVRSNVTTGEMAGLP